MRSNIPVSLTHRGGGDGDILQISQLASIKNVVVSFLSQSVWKSQDDPLQDVLVLLLSDVLDLLQDVRDAMGNMDLIHQFIAGDLEESIVRLALEDVVAEVRISSEELIQVVNVLQEEGESIEAVVRNQGPLAVCILAKGSLIAMEGNNICGCIVG